MILVDYKGVRCAVALAPAPTLFSALMAATMASGDPAAAADGAIGGATANIFFSAASRARRTGHVAELSSE